jgi:hypothetical protein
MGKIFFAVLAAIVLTGCSSFNREWKTAVAQPIPSNDIAGPWEGRWLSDRNGHTGKLRGVLRKTGADEYDAHFHATFWKIMRATYHVPLKYEEADSLFTLSGKADLGLFSGGTYTYEAEATPARFFSTYTNKYDHGTFEMSRPQYEPPRDE